MDDIFTTYNLKIEINKNIKMDNQKELEYCYVLKKGVDRDKKNYREISEDDADLAFKMVKSYIGCGRRNGSENLEVNFGDIDGGRIFCKKNDKSSLEIHADSIEGVKKIFYERLLNRKI